jgi:hypothetical protein
VLLVSLEEGAAVVSLVLFWRPGWCGTEGGMGRIEFVRLGGLPGAVEGGWWRAESSQVDFVGDQRFRERVSVEVDAEMRREGVGWRS